jgi:catechol 2,3-dioxygenase-like lactoylglutathione lyase family enzyme
VSRRGAAAFLLAAACAAASARAADRPPIIGVAHIAFRVSDLARARAFYSGLLGYDELDHVGDAARPQRVRFEVNDRQHIEVVPGLPADQDERLVRVAFETTDTAALRAYLVEKAVAVDEPAMDFGDRVLRVRDPDGHAIEFVAYTSTGRGRPRRPGAISPMRLSARILHVGLSVRDPAAADRFYKDVLGFSEIWRGGRDDARTDWINMKVPDGTEYLEYMLTGAEPLDRARLGSMHHVALVVPDIQKALETVRSRPGGWDRQTVRNPQVGRNRRWQLNLFDPDGSRAELMEPYTMR